MTQLNQNGSLDGNSPEESLTQEQVQRVIAAGEQASQLLNNPVYNVAYQQLLSTKYQEWLATDVKEERKREGLWHEAQGLIRVTEMLAGAVDDAKRLIQTQQQAQTPEQQHQDYLDTQGFGIQ